MVNYESIDLDRTFSALTDATRRSILARLEVEGEITVGGIAAQLPIKLPAVLNHLGVLESAGLIRRSKQGRVVTISIDPDPMKPAIAWLKRYERFWQPRLDRLARFAEAQERKALRKGN